MKIYFTSPIRGIDQIEDHVRAIYEVIKKLNYVHVDNVIARLDQGRSFYDKLDKGGKITHSSYFDETIDRIKMADINVFECSVPSLGVGFQIEKSIDYNKPTIVLYLKGNIPHFLAGTQNDKLFLREYTKENLAQVVSDVIEDAKHSADKRFNFFISPSLLSYIEEESKKFDMTKSAFIRRLILEHKKKGK
ncbi:hypothetical protein COS52_01060 [Candidatus Roizmanbacteria bacterium CG03_land_8_20_14_0_80_39_12]|uniref:Ribbon-helix-helix protein CopG domain-containing protein n=1 Tax=Candidatus Roizmanbacteria bacterium CG03_land_8_20_14_0_80_39_12 TaxID=1974847 RepID=A0A2M7BTC1_9BACT|nr:MAG: hypothetical protein COS52_01060 [Candidatus Roizmanbacteria bacterium CG03_land_8_20_14_0_80_39_12]